MSGLNNISLKNCVLNVQIRFKAITMETIENCFTSIQMESCGNGKYFKNSYKLGKKGKGNDKVNTISNYVSDLILLNAG